MTLADLTYRAAVRQSTTAGRKSQGARGVTKPNVNQHVHQLLEQLVSTDQETGIQVAAYLDGQIVVDAAAGLADPESGRLMDGDTLINVWSAGKGVAATTIHALVERGLLEYDAPLTRYW